jgi:hypothetical protein
MRLLFGLLVSTAMIGARPDLVAGQMRTQDATSVRRELEAWYERNKRGFLEKNVPAIMALRADDFHTVGPDNVPKNRADMEQYTVGILNGINRWISMSFDLDSIRVSGDTASAVVHQHLVRMALRPDGLVHHVETWATQRETWRKTRDGWKLYRVDNVRDQRRLVDGKPG